MYAFAIIHSETRYFTENIIRIINSLIIGVILRKLLLKLDIALDFSLFGNNLFCLNNGESCFITSFLHTNVLLIGFLFKQS